MNPNNHKKSKIIKISILILLIMLIATCMVYSFYVKNNGQEALKKELLSKMGNHDFAFFLDNPIYAKMNEKIKTENYEANSQIKMATTMENNMFSKLDLSKFELSHDVKKDNENEKSYRKLDIRYSGNPVLTLDFILNVKQVAVKSDEIVNRYVGINKQNMQNMANQLWETEVDLSAEKKWKNFLFDREPIEFEKIVNSPELTEYANLFKESISAGNFSKKENVVLTLDSEQITTTEYTVELDSNQTNQLWNGLSERLSQENTFMTEFVVKNVENFEEESEILEYTDNDNLSETQGEENNFYTSINIWGENTLDENENTTANQTNSISNTTENNVTNNTHNENTVPITNSVHLNTTENNNVQEDRQEPEIEQPEQQEVPNEQTETSEQVSNHTNTTQNVIEEDNVRRQGFIGVNEETEENLLEEENFIIGENYEETLKNIEKLATNINWSSYLLSGAKANCSQEELTEIFERILRERINENNRLVIKIYVSEENVIKMNFELLETEESLDFEIVSKSENEKYLLITALKGKEEAANGYRVSFYKKEDDAITKAKININKIHKNKIHQKTNIDLQTKGTINSKKYTTTMDVAYSNGDGEFKIELENSLNFDSSPEVEDLNDENCLFMDTLSNEELLLTRDAIQEKAREVLREKNRNLNIIDISNSNSIVQQTEQANQPSEDENARQQVKEVLIQTLRDKMREYLDNGNNLRIEDLESLEIPGYDVQTSISSDLAIITVNGFRFNLDSDFNLSDS